MLITSSVDTKWAPLVPPEAELSLLVVLCNGSITIICWEEDEVECAIGDGWEDEGRNEAPAEVGGIVPIG